MPQYPLVPAPGGTSATLNVTAATVIKPQPGRVFTINVLVAGAAGAVYDSVSTSGNTAANEVAVIPATVGPINLNAFPFANGIVIAPGAAQVVSVSWS
jgi:hypothetical protein